MRLVCDFCYDPDPQWMFTIPEGTMLGQLDEISVVVDSGEWLACTLCADAIEARDIATLSERALLNPALRDMPKETVLARSVFILSGFLSHNPGPRVPFRREPQ